MGPAELLADARAAAWELMVAAGQVARAQQFLTRALAAHWVSTAADGYRAELERALALLTQLSAEVWLCQRMASLAAARVT